MRPTACVSHASYSCCVCTSSGCRKMAWLAAVRLAPAALSSRRLSSSTRGSPFLTSSLDWNDSMMVERWLAVPLSMAVGTPAAVSASCTLTSRSMNCTKTSTRSSPGVDLIRRTTADSLAPCWRPPMMTPSLASSPPMPPSSAAGRQHVGRTAALQPSCTHSCWLAASTTAPSRPRWPQQESSASSLAGASASAAGRPASSILMAAPLEEAPWPFSPSRCSSRTFSKKRSERTRAVSSLSSRRSRCTWSRVHAIWSLSPFSSSVIFLNSFSATTASVMPSFTHACASGTASASPHSSTSASLPAFGSPEQKSSKCLRGMARCSSSLSLSFFLGWRASKKSIASRAKPVCRTISARHCSSCCWRVLTISSHAAAAVLLAPLRSKCAHRLSSASSGESEPPSTAASRASRSFSLLHFDLIVLWLFFMSSASRWFLSSMYSARSAGGSRTLTACSRHGISSISAMFCRT
mmetsp:Transcript_35217/g.83114  ORF Transcript_35217/g.83114 Transcript_35217/m.83114 type:complete len:466 (+) Transcript_35217:366-1763(+)